MLPGVGVFGTSLTARVIIPLLKNEGFAVKALWGRTQEEAEELAKEMNVPFYTNRIDDVLLHQDVDLVCINLPPPLTRQIAVKTLVFATTPAGVGVPCRVNSNEEVRFGPGPHNAAQKLKQSRKYQKLQFHPHPLGAGVRGEQILIDTHVKNTNFTAEINMFTAWFQNMFLFK
uniref:Gfo/Idh/MocA-like oxidoreductase domain containing 1 n=1 Tax=Nothobranchius furzeri TaxID=105023 RepID=A0A8C6LZM6_NOTFU